MEEHQIEQLQQFDSELLDLMEENRDLPAYMVAWTLISRATHLCLHAAPSKCVAMKTIMQSVKDGIEQFEDNPNGVGELDLEYLKIDDEK